jgi:hypothetical protein
MLTRHGPCLLRRFDVTNERDTKDATNERKPAPTQMPADSKIERQASDQVKREDREDRKDMGRGRLSRGHRRADTDECRELDHGTRLATPAEEERIQKGEVIDPRDDPDMSPVKGDVAVGAQNPAKIPGRGSAEERAKAEEKKASKAVKAGELSAEEQAAADEEATGIRRSAIGHGFP